MFLLLLCLACRQRRTTTQARVWVSSLVLPLFDSRVALTNFYLAAAVHCCVTRSGKNYHFAFQTADAETCAMIASKQHFNKTANYYMFDALRGGVNARLSKKAGHYIGKLRRDKDQPVRRRARHVVGPRLTPERTRPGLHRSEHVALHCRPRSDLTTSITASLGWVLHPLQ